MFASILSRYKDDSGDLGISDEGWKQVEQYFKNGSPAVAKTDLFARIASGEWTWARCRPRSSPNARSRSRSNVETVVPSVGVPLAVEQVALVKGTDKKDEALKFIDWFGSADVQGAFAQQFNSMPVNKARSCQGQARGGRVLRHAQAAGHRLEFRPGEHGRLGGEDRTGIHDVDPVGYRRRTSRTAAASAASPRRYSP